jgi:hypothetical protein
MPLIEWNTEEFLSAGLRRFFGWKIRWPDFTEILFFITNVAAKPTLGRGTKNKR